MKQRTKRRNAYKLMGKQMMCTSKRCKSYVAGCVTCDTFKFLDTYGRFPRDFEEFQTYSTEQERMEVSK